MRTIYLILLCLLILAPCANARRDGDDDSSDKAAKVESRDNSSDRSDRSSGSSSDSASTNKPTESRHESDSSSSYHPSESKHDDPPAPIVRNDPPPEPPKPDPPKPAENTSSSTVYSYHPSNPDPEPQKNNPPPVTVTDNPSSRGSSESTVSRREEKKREKTAEEVRSNRSSDYHPDTSENNIVIKTSDKPAGSNAPNPPTITITPSAYHPGKDSTSNPHVGADFGKPNAGSVTATGHVQGSQDNSRSSRRTDYSDKKQAKLDERAKEAQAKAQLDAEKKANNKPDIHIGPSSGDSGGGYKPGDHSGKPGGSTSGHGGAPWISPGQQGSFHPSNGKLDGTHPKDDHDGFTVGYRPGGKPSRPKGYLPPRVEDGMWHYDHPDIHHTPPFVDDRHFFHPRPRFDRPCHYGHWAYDYYPGYSWRSFYFYFGLYPYVEVSSIQECPQEEIVFVSDPIYVSGGSYVRESRWDRIDEALADIRSAWIAGRFDLLKLHVQPESTLAVLTDGEYDYQISSDDYVAMTQDALADLNTISFIWNKVRERSDGTIMAFADHSYWSNDRAKTVYVSYTLKRIGRDYYITEIGSSMNPLN